MRSEYFYNIFVKLINVFLDFKLLKKKKGDIMEKFLSIILAIASVIWLIGAGLEWLWELFLNFWFIPAIGIFLYKVYSHYENQNRIYEEEKRRKEYEEEKRKIRLQEEKRRKEYEEEKRKIRLQEEKRRKKYKEKQRKQWQKKCNSINLFDLLNKENDDCLKYRIDNETLSLKDKGFLLYKLVCLDSKNFDHLLANDVDIDFQYENDTPLLYAIKNDKYNNVKKLIEHGANIEYKNNNGFSALLIASKYGYKDIVELLISHNVDINAKDYRGNTSLVYAHNSEIVSILIENGANITDTDNKGVPIYINLARYGSQNALDELLKSVKKPLFKKVIGYIYLSGYDNITLKLYNLELNQLGVKLTYSTKSKENFDWESKELEVKKILGLNTIDLSTDVEEGKYLIQVYTKSDESSMVSKLKIDGKKPTFVQYDEKDFTTYLFFKPLSGVTLEQWRMQKTLIEHELKIPIDIELYDHSHRLYPSYGTETLIVFIESRVSVMPNELGIGGKYLKTLEKENGYVEYQFSDVEDIEKWYKAKDEIMAFINKRVNIVQEGLVVKLEESIEEMIPKILGLKDSQKNYPKLYDVVSDGVNTIYYYTFLPEIDLNRWKEYSRKTNFRTLFNEPDKIYKLDIYDKTNRELYDSNFCEGQLIALHELAKIPTKEELENVEIINELKDDKIFWGYGAGSKNYYTTLNDTTHTMLIGGTGKGKSNLMNGLILSLLHNIKKIDKLYLFDLKDGTEFIEYENLESDKIKIFGEETTPTQLLNSLLEIEAEMRLRNAYIVSQQRKKISKAKKITQSPIYLIIDEFAAIDAMDEYTREDGKAKEDISMVLKRLAKQSRSANIKIFAQSQEPRDIMRSGISEQLLSRVLLPTTNELDAQHVISQYDVMSERGIKHTALDIGRFIFEDASSGMPILNELQFPFVDADKEYQLIYKDDVNIKDLEFSKKLDEQIETVKERYSNLKNTKRLNPLGTNNVEKKIDINEKKVVNSTNNFSKINDDYNSSLDILKELKVNIKEN